jgi:pimeloyl-ACP methyl ester carboxylesterase
MKGKENNVKTILWSCLLGALLTAALPAQDVIGDWLGTLKAGGAELRLALHIKKAADGALSATFDSVDQGTSFPASSIALKHSTLSIGIEAVHGTYEGKIDSAGSVIAGTWTQGQPFPLEFHRGVVKIPKAAKPSDIDGAWQGTLDFGTQQLRIVFHIVNTEDGLVGNADSPDQGAKGMPVVVTRDGASLKIEMKGAAAVFDGKIAADLKSISGTFAQGPNNVPLVLTPVKDAAELERHRPQNPNKPYLYREEEVSYENKVQHVRLAATFTVPSGKVPFPGVVLITGSGAQNRDEELLGHKPFLVLSDHLTRQGIAVLRADDRGTGKSTGNFATATTADFATDTEASFAYLKSRPEVNPQKLGLIGHSEGGIIAPMVAARNRDVAFIVMLAGSGVRGDEVLPAQVAAGLEALGKSHEEVEKSAVQERDILALMEREKDEAVIEKKMREITEGKMSAAQLGAQIKQIRSPWFQYFLQYDPATALSKLTCPVLALNGAKDTQVIASQNLPAIRKALEAAGNTHFEIDELPGLNHLFQTAQTGSSLEYTEIEETISPLVLNKISAWILKQ